MLLLSTVDGSFVVVIQLTSRMSLRNQFFSTVPPNVVVHEPAPHAGSRTDCEYVE